MKKLFYFSIFLIIIILLFSNEYAKTTEVKGTIQSYQEALKVYTLDQFPLDYAKIQNDLGLPI